MSKATLPQAGQGRAELPPPLTGNGVLQRLNDGAAILVVTPGERWTFKPSGSRLKDLRLFFDRYGDPDLEDKGEETMAEVLDYCERKGVKFYADDDTPPIKPVAVYREGDSYILLRGGKRAGVFDTAKEAHEAADALVRLDKDAPAVKRGVTDDEMGEMGEIAGKIEKLAGAMRHSAKTSAKHAKSRNAWLVDTVDYVLNDLDEINKLAPRLRYLNECAGGKKREAE